MDQPAIAKVVVLRALCEIFGRKLSPYAIDCYLNAVEHMSDAEFQATAQEAIATCDSFPLPTYILHVWGGQ